MSTKLSKKKAMRRRFFIFLYIVILVVLLLIVYAYPKITGAMEETMVVEYGDLKISDEIQCYIVKNETVYFADASGTVTYNYDEGTLARANSRLLDITAAAPENDFDYTAYNSKIAELLSDSKLLTEEKSVLDLDILSNDKQNEAETIDITSIGVTGGYTIASPGIVSYCLDGYETAFTPDAMRDFKKSAIEALSFDSYDLRTGKATKGEPVCKVVDSHEWYAIAWISENDLGEYEEGKTIKLVLPKSTVQGTVESILDDGSDVLVIMKFDDYYEDLATLRSVKSEIITSDYSGLMIKNSFLSSEDGVPGVYVVDVTGEATFTPVEIKAMDDDYCLVESGYIEQVQDDGVTVKQVETVQVYDEIKKVD